MPTAIRENARPPIVDGAVARFARYRALGRAMDHVQVGSDDALKQRDKKLLARWRDLRDKAKRKRERGIR